MTLRNIAAVCLIFSLLLTTAGCNSGGLSQDDLKRMALKRGSDDDDDDGDDDESSGTAAVNNAVKKPNDEEGSAAESSTDAEASDESSTRVAAGEAPNITQSGNTAPAPARPLLATDNVPYAGQVAAAPEETTSLPIAAEPLTENASVEERLTRLGLALRSYTERHSRFPNQAIRSDGQPILSWRVELLPYLGYVDLYTQFKFDEPWDSPHNKQLLAKIPHEFRDGTSSDTRILALGTELFSDKRPTSVKRVVDGIGNTVAVAQVLETAAVPWTKPEDLIRPQSTESLGNDDEPFFWAMFGNGYVYSLRKDLDRRTMSNLTAIDDEAGLTPTDIVYREEQPADPATAAGDSNPSVAGRVSPAASTTGRRREDARSAVDPKGYQPTPSAEDIAKANDSLRVIYGERYKKENERDEKRQLARDMLEAARDLDTDPAAQFALLRLAARVAAEGAELGTVEKAMEMRAEFFPDWDWLSEYPELLDVVYKAGKRTDRRLADLAGDLANEAMDEARFDDADSLGDLAAKVHKSARTKELPDSYLRTKRRLNEFRSWRGRVNSAMETLAEDEEHPNANLVVGRFYCFFRNRWDDGLPLMARGDDPVLQRLAQMELYDADTLEQQVELADEWWTAGERNSTYRRDYQVRAYYWYSKALDAGIEGVPKLRAEVRVKEAEERYPNDIDRATGSIK